MNIPKSTKNIFSVLAAVVMLLVSERLQALRPVADSTPAQYGKPFAGVPDRKDVVIYQVNMRAFSQEGNFAGVTARLDSIKDLGANVIYLMPIYPVGIAKSVNSPYCIRDYKAINTEFGNIDDLRKLVDGAHHRNMSVMLDWVGNHTSWDHAWITGHPSWYKHDSMGKIMSAGFGWTDVAQLDFDNKDMRSAMIADMKYWVYAVNIDGFRCDYADGPPTDFWKQAIDTLRNIRTHKLLFLAEAGKTELYSAGFDYIFGFKFFGNLERIFGKDHSAKSIDSVNTREYKGAANGQQVVRYTTNHDVNGSDGTPIHLFGGKEGSKAAFVVVACMKGIPMIYNGQEVGMEQSIVFPFTKMKVDWAGDMEMEKWYKKIIAIRKRSDAIKYGELNSFSTDDVCAFTKTDGKHKALVLSNLRDKAVHFKLPAGVANTSWTDDMTGRTRKISTEVLLPAYGYIILEK
jgi:glycosidase